MRGLILNVVLALVWALFSGEVSTRELTVGFLLGFAILQVFPRALGTTDYVFTTRRVLGFAWFFARELTFANIQVAAFALRRHPPLNPMIVAVPLTLKTDTGLTLLAAPAGGVRAVREADTDAHAAGAGAEVDGVPVPVLGGECGQQRMRSDDEPGRTRRGRGGGRHVRRGDDGRPGLRGAGRQGEGQGEQQKSTHGHLRGAAGWNTAWPARAEGRAGQKKAPAVGEGWGW